MENEATGIRETKFVCPYCAEAFTGILSDCPHCDEELDSALADVVAGVLEEATLADAEAGNFRHAADAAFRRVRSRTVVSAGLLAAFLLLAAAASGGAPRALAITAAVGALIPSLLFGIQDLALPRPKSLVEPARTAAAYLKSIREGRWVLAWNLLLPRSRGRPWRRGRVPGIVAGGTLHGVETPGALREYWRSILRGAIGESTRARFAHLRLASVDGDRAQVEYELRLRRQQSFGILSAGRVDRTVSLEMRLFRVRGRWYVVDGFFIPPTPMEDS